jgi:chorismate mutase
MEKVSKDMIDDIDDLTSEEKEELLSAIRKKVNDIDNEIVKLLGKRAYNSRLIGKLKSVLNLPNLSSEREKEIISELIKNLPSTLPVKSLVRIYKKILDESRAIQSDERKKK